MEQYEQKDFCRSCFRNNGSERNWISGSIAADFTDETTPVIPSKPAETPSKVAWDENNFGALVDNITLTEEVAPDEDGNVLAENLEAVTSISLPEGFNGEIKGLEYFSGLTSFNAAANAGVENTSLDFSQNTVLETISIESEGAPDVSSITLPDANADTGKYSLTSLTLVKTALSSLDLSDQAALKTVVVTNGELASVTLAPTNATNPTDYETLNLSSNSLESIDLKNYTVGTLNLSNNHIGVLDLEDVTTDATLSNQTFYVAADAGSVNLKDYFPSIDLDKVTVTPDSALEDGVLDLSEAMSYEYDTKGGTLTVNLEKANPMYRLYNPNSGEHFYTKVVREKDALVDLGWKYEGIGWVAPLKGEDVYRLYNPNAGDHHYTMDENEKNILVSIGWKYEGVGWFSGGKVPVYREYNPNAKEAGAHNYTPNKTENDFLVSVGWLQEGIGWYAEQ